MLGVNHLPIPKASARQQSIYSQSIDESNLRIPDFMRKDLELMKDDNAADKL